MPAKAEAIAQRSVDLHWACGVRNVIQVACRIGKLVIDRWRSRLVFDREYGRYGFDRSGSTEQVTCHRLRRADRDLVGVLAEEYLNGIGLGDVALWRRRAMDVDVINVGRFQVRAFDRHAHRTDRAFAARRGLSDVVSISRKPKAYEFGVDLRSTIPSMIEFLENERGTAFAHDEAITLNVEGSARLFGSIVSRRERLHGIEPADRHRTDHGFRTASDDHVRETAFDEHRRVDDRVVARCAGARRCVIRPFEAVAYRDISSANIADQHRHEERRDPVWASRFKHRLLLLLIGPHSPDTGAEDDADTITILGFEIQLRIFDRHIAGRHPELGEEVHAIDRLTIDERKRIEALDLASKLGIVLLGIEPRDTSRAGPTARKTFPIRGKIIADRRQRAHACYDYSAPGIGHKKQEEL